MLRLTLLLLQYSKPFEIVDNVPVPTPGPGEVLVRVTASSLCMSDVISQQGAGASPLPYCGGHEPVGVVEQPGPGVKAFAVGDRVGFMPASQTCQNCPLCLTGHHRHCQNRTNVGFSGSYGGFSQYCVADALSTVKIPDEIADQHAAPLFCAGVTAYSAVKKAARQRLAMGATNTLNIVGCGGVGHLAILYAKAMGFRVIAFDVADDKLELAKQSGADVVFNSATTPVHQIEPAPVTIVISAALKAYDFAIKATRSCGAVIAIGVPHEAYSMNRMSLDLHLFCQSALIC